MVGDGLLGGFHFNNRVSNTRPSSRNCFAHHHNARRHTSALTRSQRPFCGQRTFFLKAASLFFFVCALIYVPMTKATMLKNGTQVCSGRNCWANASAKGEVIQLTFMTGMKPARTVARTWWNVRAPAMRAMEIR